MGPNEFCRGQTFYREPCPHPVWDDHEKMCIFHSSKVDQKGTRFETAINDYMASIEANSSARFYDFTYFYFPDFHWKGKKLAKEAIFCQTRFMGKVDFSSVHFEKEAFFWWAVFEKGANFHSTKFENKAIFFEADFLEEKEEAVFKYCVFKKDVDFNRATFKSRCDFSFSSFSEGGQFINTKFLSPSSFYKTSVSSNLLFQETVFDYVDFRRCSILGAGIIKFLDLSLEKAVFLDVEIDRMDFVKVVWPESGLWFKKLFGIRHILFDERLHTDNNALELFNEGMPGRNEYKMHLTGLSNTYRLLKRNYDQKTDYYAGGQFHIGEMEIRRRRDLKFASTYWNKLDYIVASYYKFASYYGESYLLPLFWLAFGIGLFSLFFMFSGLSPANTSSTYSSFNYDFHFSFVSNFSQFAKDWWSSFVYTLQVFSLQRWTASSPQNLWGHFWAVLARVYSPVMIALFLLALRRRFKR